MEPSVLQLQRWFAKVQYCWNHCYCSRSRSGNQDSDKAWIKHSSEEMLFHSKGEQILWPIYNFGICKLRLKEDGDSLWSFKSWNLSSGHKEGGLSWLAEIVILYLWRGPRINNIANQIQGSVTFVWLISRQLESDTNLMTQLNSDEGWGWGGGGEMQVLEVRQEWQDAENC